MDRVFRALADETRRYLLDLLHEDNGQTLSELCERLDMTRQSATQHLGVLEEANLISTVRRGREKLHYLNPVPIHEIQERWIEKFERPRLQALSTLKRRAEGHMTDKPSFVYVTYIESTPEEVWRALTDPDLSARYWGHRNVSDWEAGSRWEHQRIDGTDIADIVGTVVESAPPTRLVTTWADPENPQAGDDVAGHLRHRAPRRDRPPDGHARGPHQTRPSATRPPRAGRRCCRTSSRSWRPGTRSPTCRGRCRSGKGLGWRPCLPPTPRRSTATTP